MWQMFLEAIKNMFFLFGYFASGSFPKALSKQKEEELFKRFKEGDMSARDELIESNLRLVAYVVKKYRKENVDSEDFISIGTIGLIFDYITPESMLVKDRFETGTKIKNAREHMGCPKDNSNSRYK